VIVGFTGTREGMTDEQKDKFGRLVKGLQPEGFHHGDCVGADEDAHGLVREHAPDTPITVHPPESSIARAHGVGDVIRPPSPYLGRKRALVDASGLLVATPDGPERRRSGTWSTVRYARRQEGVRVLVIHPDGSLDR